MTYYFLNDDVSNISHSLHFCTCFKTFLKSAMYIKHAVIPVGCFFVFKSFVFLYIYIFTCIMNYIVYTIIM